MSNFHLKDDFRPGGPASQVPASWFNKVANFLNNLIPGRGINLTKSERGASVIECTLESGGGDLSGVGANKIVGTNANSAATAAASLLTTAPTVDKVLTVVKNGTAISWQNADRPAENPSSTTNLSATYPGNDAATNNSWTAGSTTGLTITQLVRVKWSGTYLYGYYRTFKYDRFGRLYSVSAETRYTIDTPVTYNP